MNLATFASAATIQRVREADDNDNAEKQRAEAGHKLHKMNTSAVVGANYAHRSQSQMRLKLPVGHAKILRQPGQPSV